MKFADVNTLVNFTVATDGTLVFFKLKTQKKAAGWTVSCSSDGLTYNAAGDQITTNLTGAGGFHNTNAWIVLREPGGRREWCYQHTTGLLWRIKYSALSRFIIGSPGITRVPQAADEQVICGSGSDAAPVGANFHNSSQHRVHIVCQSTPISGCYPFLFWVTLSPGTTEAPGAVWQEPMAPGSYDALDADPCIVGAATAGSNMSAIFSTSSKAWFAYGLGGATFTALQSGVNATFGGAMPPDLASGKDVNGRPIYTFNSGGVRVKGYGSTIAIKGPPRAWPSTANRATDAYVYLGTMVLPYPDNTEPGV